jgi:Uma2 family endonuclease
MFSPAQELKMATTRLMTAEDLWHMDDDEYRYELVRGELQRMSPASLRHGIVAATLARLLGNYATSTAAGVVVGAETGFLLARNPDLVLAPDAAFIQSGRVSATDDQEGFIELAPDLVVEVVSRSDRLTDVSDKVADYLSTGVRLVWIVEPRSKRITAYTPDRTARVLSDDDELDGGEVLPGFRVPVAEIFS